MTSAQSYWRSLGTWSVDSWNIVFAIRHDGALVGSQGLEGDDFLRLRTVDSWSYLGRDARGRGWGKQMRRAVLTLAFGHARRRVRDHVGLARQPRLARRLSFSRVRRQRDRAAPPRRRRAQDGRRHGAPADEPRAVGAQWRLRGHHCRGLRTLPPVLRPNRWLSGSRQARPAGRAPRSGSACCPCPWTRCRSRRPAPTSAVESTWVPPSACLSRPTMSITRKGSISRGIRLADVRISAASSSATSRPTKSTKISRAASISSLIRRSTC